MTLKKPVCGAIALLAGLLWSLTASAQNRLDEDSLYYVESNQIAVFYHEFGHAMIDILRLPIFGQEEDAADVLSVIMVDQIFDEESAVAITFEAAESYLIALEESGGEFPFWDTHGHDLQRYYNMACLFYGASPDTREELAQDMGLPEERAVTCEEEFQLADESWGPPIDEVIDAGPGSTIRFSANVESDLDVFTADLIEAEVDHLNSILSLPEELQVTVGPCGEPNAFYDPNTIEIIMCTEFSDYFYLQSSNR